jgi:hypothetical protein
MNRDEFQCLQRTQNKCINEDVDFHVSRGRDEMDFYDVRILTDAVDGIKLAGHYNCKVGSVTYNISVEGVGPICRYDVNRPIHRDAGRYHVHELTHPEDPRRQLPHAIKREDLIGLTARQVFEKLCLEWNVTHVGTFFEPEVKCK